MPETPTDLELTVLKALWLTAPMTAREIREALQRQGKHLAYTSVITTVQRMVQKKQLEQLSPVQGKAFRFNPLLRRETVSSGMLGELVEKVFEGSAEAVMMSLFDVKDLDADEIANLRKLLNKKIRETKS